MKNKPAENYDEFSVRMLPAGEEDDEIKSVRRRKKESFRMNIVQVFLHIIQKFKYIISVSNKSQESKIIFVIVARNIFKYCPLSSRLLMLIKGFIFAWCIK